MRQRKFHCTQGDKITVSGKKTAKKNVRKTVDGIKSAEHFFNHAPSAPNTAYSMCHCGLVGIYYCVGFADDTQTVRIGRGKDLFFSIAFHKGFFINVAVLASPARWQEGFDKSKGLSIAGTFQLKRTYICLGGSPPVNRNGLAVGLCRKQLQTGFSGKGCNGAQQQQ